MTDLLMTREMGARDLSQMLGIQEKEVYEHLPNIARSVKNQGKRLIIRPASCLACGFVFEERRRFKPPGRCPKCRGTRIERPAYRIL